MIEHWEEFKIGPGQVSAEMHVTLSPQGEILLGARACEKFGHPAAVVLLFDKVNSRIALNPADKHVANAYPLHAKGPNRYRVIRAARFCSHYGIKVDRRIVFAAPEINKRGFLVLDLKKTVIVASRVREN